MTQQQAGGMAEPTGTQYRAGAAPCGDHSDIERRNQLEQEQQKPACFLWAVIRVIACPQNGVWEAMYEVRGKNWRTKGHVKMHKLLHMWTRLTKGDLVVELSSNKSLKNKHRNKPTRDQCRRTPLCQVGPRLNFPHHENSGSAGKLCCVEVDF